jgi:hypothetical protein
MRFIDKVGESFKEQWAIVEKLSTVASQHPYYKYECLVHGKAIPQCAN